MRKLLSIILVVVMAFAVGCTANEQAAGTAADDSTAAAAQEPAREYSIAAVCTSAGNQSTTNMVEHMQMKAAEYGNVTVTPYYYEANVNTLVEIIENLTSQNVDAIVLQAQGTSDGLDAMKAAVEAGIKVALFDTDMPELDYSFIYCASEYDLGYAIGSSAGTWATENLVANGIEVIAGVNTYREVEPAIHREEGIVDGIMETCPEAQIVMYTDCCTTADGVKCGEDFLAAYPNMNLIGSINDASILGIYEAYTSAGITENVGLFGTDCNEENVKIIANNGIVRGTVDLNLGGVGKLFVEGLYNILTGEGDAPEKTNFFPMISVTAENVGDYVE